MPYFNQDFQHSPYIIISNITESLWTKKKKTHVHNTNNTNIISPIIYLLLSGKKETRKSSLREILQEYIRQYDWLIMTFPRTCQHSLSYHTNHHHHSTICIQRESSRKEDFRLELCISGKRLCCKMFRDLFPCLCACLSLENDCRLSFLNFLAVSATFFSPFFSFSREIEIAIEEDKERKEESVYFYFLEDLGRSN